jgi:DNA-binding NtrC family response regulator
MEIMSSYSWPGNVRELENLIERLSILVDSDAVYPNDLPDYLRNENLQNISSLAAPDLPESGLDFNKTIDAFENALILQALRRTGGNKKAAAKLLNLNRTTLVEKIKKKGLDCETARVEGEVH